MRLTHAPQPSRAVSASIDSLLAASVSAAALLWRGRRDAHSAWAPLNAVSHWLWPRRALRENRATWRYTLTGTAVHYASSALWGGIYAWLRGRRRSPNAINAVADAAAVTALAAVVDLQAVPQRLTPGFEHRLRPTSLALVYGGFALGLALGDAFGRRRR
jgi:hypothetical protein